MSSAAGRGAGRANSAGAEAAGVVTGAGAEVAEGRGGSLSGIEEVEEEEEE